MPGAHCGTAGRLKIWKLRRIGSKPPARPEIAADIALASTPPPSAARGVGPRSAPLAEPAIDDDLGGGAGEHAVETLVTRRPVARDDDETLSRRHRLTG